MLLRLEPETVIPRHHHTGEVAANVDGWRAVGATVVTVLISVQGGGPSTQTIE